MSTKHFSVAACLLFFAFFTANAQSTWQYLPNSPGGFASNEGRIDDVFFLDPNEGWCATGIGNIFHTTNGGNTWTKQLNTTADVYFRCIEFRNSQLGFAGSLNNSFYRTTNGGQTWTNIASQISPLPEAICGISIPTDSTVYAVGQWNEPAFYIKSSNGGQSFTSHDMSAHANGLVDVLFTSRDTGWVSGKGIGGATILRTTNGGGTWTELFNSGINGEYVWKLQRVTPLVWVGSIQTMTSTNGRIVKSTDGGITWTSISAPTTDVQGIGFSTPELGWIGDYSNSFYETTDGGLNWVQKFFGGSYNRFFFLSPTLAFASGAAIYKYAPEDPSSTGEAPPQWKAEKFEFAITPNPTSGEVQVQFELKQTDNVRISVLSASGVELRNLYRERLPEGQHNLTLNTGDLPSGNYLLWIQRNHGLHTKPLVIVR